MRQREEKAFCRICPVHCGMVLTVDERGRLSDIRSDKDHPRTQGFACIKGLQAVETYNSPARLLHPLKRLENGSFERIPLEQALDEIADKLKSIIERNSADAVAAFRGTACGLQAVAYRVLEDWLRVIGSRSFFTTNTVDQSAKTVTAGRLGSWDAGRNHFHNSDVMMIIGGNPLVSASVFGFDIMNPTKKIHEAKARGMKFVVIDPRYTETARHADLFIQPPPGEDPSIIAGILRCILANNWHDKEFCEKYVAQLGALTEAVEHFTPDYVEGRTGVPGHQIEAAARIFARDARRGFAVCGTGPSMALRSNLSDHLVECLNVVCGRFQRTGDRVTNPGVLRPSRPRYAEVRAPTRPWEKGFKSRVGSFGLLNDQMMSCRLADEILMSGEGQIKALIVDGGNPASTLPDQRKTLDALRSLELLVAIEPYMTTTARVSHYILPPMLQYEQVAISNVNIEYEEAFAIYAFQQYSPGWVSPPEDSDVVDDWYVFWALAKRLGRTFVLDGVSLDMSRAPTADELLAILTRHSNIPLEEVKVHGDGKFFDIEQYVEPARPDANGKFEVAPVDIVAELRDVAAESYRVSSAEGGERFPFRLTVRRSRELFNSLGLQFEGIRRRRPYNPAYLHPLDIQVLGLKDGDRVRIVSEHGSIQGRVKVDEALRRGVVSMTHGCGGLPDDEPDYDHLGSTTGLLISTDRHFEAINAMARLSGVPVDILPDLPNNFAGI